MSYRLRFAKMLPGASSRPLLLFGLLFACGIFQILAQPPDVLNYPNVVTFGAFTGTICYSNQVGVKTLTPITTRTLTFVPATALTYVICYNNLILHPFEVTLIGGGLGATTQTSIVLTSYTGKLYANCDAYCT
uniref:Transmembrane protein n=1 Tax=Anopheles minimus TaxID=112268 RepID=A0A182WIE9_9DIPT